MGALGSVLQHLALQGKGRPHVDMGFNAKSAPQITIQAYMQRISDHFNCSTECLLAGLVYIDRIAKMHRSFVVNPLNVHRVALAGVLLATKFLDDVYFNNGHYAAVSGVQLKELNRLEQRFLKLINWRLYILPEDYKLYESYICLTVRAPPAARHSAQTT